MNRPVLPWDRYLAADFDGLLEMLHSAIIDLYGVSTCQEYLGSAVENIIQIELLQILSSEPWTWEIDVHSTLIEDAFSIQVSVTGGDQKAGQTMYLGFEQDGSFSWFTDCGDPQSSSTSDQDIPFDDQLMSTVLDGEYEVCGSGCSYKESTEEQSKTYVWCRDNGCNASNVGVCTLFNREKDDPPQDPDSWDFVVESPTKMQKDWEYEYHCFCVR